MTNNDNWMDDLASEDTKTIDELKTEEEARQKKSKKSRPGAVGKKAIKGLNVEVLDRMGAKGPLVMMYGQGPRRNIGVNVPISAEIRNRLDKETVGPRGQVCSLLISYALEKLTEEGQCVTAESIK